MWKFKRCKGLNRGTDEEKYSQVKVVGRIMVMQALGNCRRGKHRKNEGKYLKIIEANLKRLVAVFTHVKISKSQDR